MPYKQGVTGSNPVAPTSKIKGFSVSGLRPFLLYTNIIQTLPPSGKFPHPFPCLHFRSVGRDHFFYSPLNTKVMTEKTSAAVAESFEVAGVIVENPAELLTGLKSMYIGYLQANEGIDPDEAEQVETSYGILKQVLTAMVKQAAM